MTRIGQLFRACLYPLLGAACLWFTHWSFGGSDVAFLSLFTLVTLVVELILNCPQVDCARPRLRFAVYLMLVAGLLVSGLFLVDKAMCVRAQSKVTQRLTTAVNAADDVVAMATDDRNVVVAISGGLLQKTGYSRQDVLERPITFLVPEFSVAETLNDLKTLQTPGHAGWLVREHRTLQFQTKEGGRVPVRMTIIACQMATDRLVSRDVLFLMLAEETH